MRISDWSSDVCSSDLHHVRHRVIPGSFGRDAREGDGFVSQPLNRKFAPYWFQSIECFATRIPLDKANGTDLSAAIRHLDPDKPALGDDLVAFNCCGPTPRTPQQRRSGKARVKTQTY